MIPLTLSRDGEKVKIAKVRGNDEMIKHIADMGIVPDETVTVLSAGGGNIIVKVKDSRVAIGKEQAGKIMVYPD